MTGFSIVTGIISAIFLVIGLVLDVSGKQAADGILALFAVFLVFCVIGVFIVFVLKREVKYIEHPELKKDKELEQKATYSKCKRKSSNYRINPYTDELEEDDGLSIEEIDHLESDIYDDM